MKNSIFLTIGMILIIGCSLTLDPNLPIEGDFRNRVPLHVAAEKGDIVVAVIGEEATVKRYFPEKHRIRLEPANPVFGPIIVDKKSPEFRIAGKVIGLLRRM